MFVGSFLLVNGVLGDARIRTENCNTEITGEKSVLERSMKDNGEESRPSLGLYIQH
ncbi:hypothetical protein HanXRQr2_Chr11g0493411 [Helianthus annuus]|uniref:Uncharacterized protein n=1 Tax=Helianthus annuus TaxID=4232 RepID=A0A251UL11_HELAN|nr:hypothetical protein HanXRQr2_Chr11g0493411 [Helianthus annuus]KAJ0875361.1 hypothetical protein HanPSC8_Chr11g0475431 [Helianthus annuus]